MSGWCGRLAVLRNARVRSSCAPIFHQPARSNGYVVLIPEIGEESNEVNSLLNDEGIPKFNDLTVERCIAIIRKQVLDYDNEIKSFEEPDFKVTNVFTDIVKPIENVDSPLEMTWGVAKTLYFGNSTMMPTKSYLDIHNHANRARCTKYISRPIYDAVVKAKKEKTSFTEEEIRVLNKYELEGRLNGMQLSDKKRERLLSTLRRLQIQQSQFRERNRLSFLQFKHNVRNQELVRDFPESLLRAMSTDSNEPSRGPWKVTHQPFVYDGFMEYCPDKSIRYMTWFSNIQRCSLNEDKSIDTSVNLKTIRELRNEKAKMLGYKSYVDLVMETKMAGSAENVEKMISTLLERAKPYQTWELEKLEDFAKERGFDVNLDYCDISYWARKQKKSLYQYDEEHLREYFPLPVVLQGLFDLCSKLFDIKIVENSKVNVWHEDVKFYQIFNPDSPTPVAGFYFDPYAREKEKLTMTSGCGWMLPIRNRSNITGSTPLASLIFNFQVPIYGKPSLLSFSEVKTLFHKFGNALKHLLSETNYSDVSGLSNVEWDTAEVTGHVLTHWLYEPSVVQSISSHYGTNEQLPSEIAQNLDGVRKHMAGYNLCKELYLSALDLKMHVSDDYWRDIIKNLWPKYHTLPLNKYDCHPCQFTKIFAEEWGAAYYCDLWSRMIAADIYSAFHEVKHDENSILEVGVRYRDTYLASGGSCYPSELFRRFRGRDPSHKALLHTLGLKKSTNSTT